MADPGVILNDTELLLALSKHAKRDLGKDVIDLRDVAVRRLETQLNASKEQHQILLEVLSENFDSALRIINLMLVLLKSRDLDELFHKLLTKVPQAVDVDYVRFVQLTGKSSPPPLVDTTSLAIKNITHAKLEAYLGVQVQDIYDNKVSLRSIAGGDQNIYGNIADQVRSEAIIDLSMDSDFDFTLTFLVLGSTAPEQI